MAHTNYELTKHVGFLRNPIWILGLSSCLAVSWFYGLISFSELSIRVVYKFQFTIYLSIFIVNYFRVQIMKNILLRVTAKYQLLNISQNLSLSSCLGSLLKGHCIFFNRWYKMFSLFHLNLVIFRILLFNAITEVSNFFMQSSKVAKIHRYWLI